MCAHLWFLAIYSNEKSLHSIGGVYSVYSLQSTVRKWQTAILDGTGAISLNGITGTYALAVEGSAYQFDVYLNDNSEYGMIPISRGDFWELLADLDKGKIKSFSVSLKK